MMFHTEKDYREVDITKEKREIILLILVSFNEKIWNRQTSISDGLEILKNDLAHSILFQFIQHDGYINNIQIEYLKEVQLGKIKN